MMGLFLDRIVVKLADSNFPEAFGGWGQGSAASATARAYAEYVKLREAVASKLGFDSVDGEVRAGNRRASLAQAAKDGATSAEDKMEYGDLSKRFEQQAAHPDGGRHFQPVLADGGTAVPLPGTRCRGDVRTGMWRGGLGDRRPASSSAR